MYKYLKSIAVFIAVAETGAFNKAAIKLGLKASVVSHHINKLEAHIGTTLIYRTTRSLTLSDQGKALYESVHLLYQDTQSLIDQLSANSNQPKGILRISVPQFIPDQRIEKALWSFCKTYPDINVTLQYTDEQVKLPNDDIDIAIRIGRQTDSILMTKNLSHVEHILVVSPALLQKHSSIENPEHLMQIEKINLQCASNKLVFSKGSTKKTLEFTNSNLTLNSINASLNAAIEGFGFADLPPALCESAIQRGQLIRVLADWNLPKLPIGATYSGKALHNSLITLLLSHIADYR
jgi:DNA-binding transcriptional LysR family regulator